MSEIFTVNNGKVTSWITTDGINFKNQSNEIMSRTNLIYLYTIYETKEEARAIAEAPKSKGQIAAQERIAADIKASTDALGRKEEEKRKKDDARAETAATMEFIRNTLHIAEEFQFAVFKTFIKELVFIDTKLVNKALFAVTLNNKFKGFLYKVENDSEFLSHVSANQMKEVLEMILSRQ